MSKISERSNGKAPRPLFAIERDLAPRWAMLWVLICGLALMGAIATGTAVSVNKFEENAIENGKEGLESAVLLLARHFDQQFRDFLIPQEDLVTELQSQGIQSADIFQSEMGTLAVHEDLRIRITSWNDNAGVNLFDSNGILINSSRTWPMPDVKIGDRAYFRALRSDPSLPLAVEVVKSRLAGSSHAIVFARRISGARGQLLGVITRAISPEVLETFFASAVLGEGATIALHHRDGALLARYPQIGSLIGQNFKNGPSQQQAVFEAPHLTVRLISPIDGIDRLVSSRMLSSLPFVVVATRTVDSTLVAWRSQTRFFVNVAGLSLCVIIVTLYLMIRQMRLQHESAQRRLTIEKQRLDKAINNMSQGLLLFDASMRLIVCNRKYIEMYGLSPEVIKPGCTLRDVMAHRKEHGYFSGEEDQHCRKVLENLDKGDSKLLQTSDGRLIEIRNEPVPDGGVVGHSRRRNRARPGSGADSSSGLLRRADRFA
jgi:PAS domain-containing protein